MAGRNESRYPLCRGSTWMTDVGPTKDLVLLTADKNCEFTVRGLLSRHASLGIRVVSADIFVHPERDPGCLLKSDVFLAAFRNSHSHAIVIFDREGCGRERCNRDELETQVEAALEGRGWNGSQVAAIVLDPELEIWAWSDSPEVDQVLGWHLANPDLRTWLRAEQFLQSNSVKPSRPKEALEAALQKVRRARSSSIFRSLAETVSVERCNDSAFLKFKSTLINWFPAS